MYPHTLDLAVPAPTAMALLKLALAQEQLIIVSDIDMQARLQARKGRYTLPHHLLGIHGPELSKALRRADAGFRPQPPCNGSLYEVVPCLTRIAFQEPLSLALNSRSPAVYEVLEQASESIQHVMYYLRGCEASVTSR